MSEIPSAPLTDFGLQARVAAFTHTGLVRSRNEDAILVGTWWSQDSLRLPWTTVVGLHVPLLCAVADGLGGHRGGDIASRLAVETLSQQQTELGKGETAIRAAILALHQRVLSSAEPSRGYSAPGTTLAGLVLKGERGWVFNIGDSRVYRWRDGFLTQLSFDDVPNPEYGASGERRTSHQISQSLGVYEDPPEPHIREIGLTDGDLFLLCSDGLTDMLDLDSLESMLTEETVQDPAIAVASLAGAALSAGGADNLSIILVRVEAVRPAPPPGEPSV